MSKYQKWSKASQIFKLSKGSCWSTRGTTKTSNSLKAWSWKAIASIDINIVKWHDSRDIINHPGLVFRKMGLFTLLRDPIELNEFTPIPPKVKTGILKSPSTIGSIFEAVYWIYFFYSPFFCSYIRISSISSNFLAISSWRGYLLGFLFVIRFFYYLPMSNLGSCYISFLFYLYTVL